MSANLAEYVVPHPESSATLTLENEQERASTLPNTNDVGNAATTETISATEAQSEAIAFVTELSATYNQKSAELSQLRTSTEAATRDRQLTAIQIRELKSERKATKAVRVQLEERLAELNNDQHEKNAEWRATNLACEQAEATCRSNSQATAEEQRLATCELQGLDPTTQTPFTDGLLVRRTRLAHELAAIDSEQNDVQAQLESSRQHTAVLKDDIEACVQRLIELNDLVVSLDTDQQQVTLEMTHILAFFERIRRNGARLLNKSDALLPSEGVS